MADESTFHIIFIVAFAVSTIVRSIFGLKAAQPPDKVEHKAGKLSRVLLGSLILLYSVVVLIYMVRPRWFAWAAFPLPAWVRWVGAVATVGGIPLLVWVQWSLGKNFAATLHVREGHTLVTTGPYRWVRHPMYTLIFVFGIGLLLLTANWLVGGPMLVASALIIFQRLSKEEALMIEQFGDEYRRYMQRTGRFLPRLGR